MAIATDFRNAIQLLRNAEILLRSPSATPEMKKEFLRDVRGFLNMIDEKGDAEFDQLSGLLRRAREFIARC